MQIHGSDAEGYCVAENHVWLPGIYDSPATCRAAAKLPYAVLEQLGQIYRVDGENRPVTLTDLSDLS